MEREPWPGEATHVPDDAPTEVRPPPPQKERTRADELRQETRRKLDPLEAQTMTVLAVLEVSAALDRLTAYLRERDS